MHNKITFKEAQKPTQTNYELLDMSFSHPRPSKILSKKRDWFSTPKCVLISCRMFVQDNLHGRIAQ